MFVCVYIRSDMARSCTTSCSAASFKSLGWFRWENLWLKPLFPSKYKENTSKTCIFTGKHLYLQTGRHRTNSTAPMIGWEKNTGTLDDIQWKKTTRYFL